MCTKIVGLSSRYQTGYRDKNTFLKSFGKCVVSVRFRIPNKSRFWLKTNLQATDNFSKNDEIFNEYNT